MKKKFYDYLIWYTDGYYDTVYSSYIENAIDEAVKELKIDRYSEENAKKVHEYISENLI